MASGNHLAAYQPGPVWHTRLAFYLAPRQHPRRRCCSASALAAHIDEVGDVTNHHINPAPVAIIFSLPTQATDGIEDGASASGGSAPPASMLASFFCWL